MSKLREKAAGKYAFDSVETLMAFLSIDGRCLAKAKTGLRCQHPRSAPELQDAHDKGFPSPEVASSLRKAARKCMCDIHVEIDTGYGSATIRMPQEEDVYLEWNRRLWVEFLLANKVHYVYANERPPDLGDEERWREQLGLLASGLPLGKRDDNPSSTAANPPAEPSLKAARTGSPAPEPLKRRVSNLQKRFVARGRSIGRIMTVFSRSAAPAQSTPENHDGRRQAHAIVGGFAGSNRREHPVHHEPENKDDEKSDFVGAPEWAEVKLETPEKRRGPTGDTNNGIQRFLDTAADASPGESLLSIAPSATFSVGESGFNRTPDTLHSHYDPMSTGGKGTSSCKGSTGQNGATLANPALASRTEETRPLSPDSSNIFNSTRESAGRRLGPFSLPIPVKTPPPGESSALGSKLCSGQRRPRNAAHELDTPTKSRLPPDVPAPSSPDTEEGQSEEKGQDEERQSVEGQPGASSGDADFKLYWKKSANKYRILETLLNTLEKTKNEEQRKGGYIYIYSRETARGFVKIGRSVDPWERRKHIEQGCGYKPEFLLERYMAVAHRAIETCVHCHLGEHRYWDNSCKNEGKGADEGKRPLEGKRKNSCRKSHKEWFKVRKSRAQDVVNLWHDFIETRPFDNGMLNSFWRNEVRLVWEEMGTRKKNGHPPLGLWDEVMRGALKRRDTASVGNPMADLPLRLRVRSEGAGSVLELFGEEGSSDVPLLCVPMLTRQREKPRALHTQAAPPVDT